MCASEGLEYVGSSSVPQTLRCQASSTCGASRLRSAIRRWANERASRGVGLLQIPPQIGLDVDHHEP